MIYKRIKSRYKLKQLFSVINIAKRCYMFAINKMIGINNKKIVFVSFGGKSYSDNPRAISEKMHEMYPEYELVWLFDNPQDKRKIVPRYVRCIKTGSFKALLELATSKIWVDNFTKPLYTYKSDKQLYIQTWHGDRGFKKILYDSTFISDNTKYIESKICDLFVSGSDYGDSKIKTAFQYYGEILKTGCPRNDMLIECDSNKINMIKNKLNIKENINVLLYAPTLRREAAGERKMQNNNVDLMAVIRALEETTNKEWICLVRAHSAVKGLKGVPTDIKILNVTSYEDMSELLLISNLLVTDYSSSAGDFVLLNRPVILFQPDRENYMKYDRTFYFDLDKSPYMIARNQDELVDLIISLDWDMMSQYSRQILDFYGAVETGEASKNVVEYMVRVNKII